MVNILNNAPRTKIIAILSIFTALYAVLRIIPSVPMIGTSGATFSLSDIIAPLYGIILGPYTGGLSVIIGSFIAMFGKPPVFLGLDFLPATVASVSTGLLIKKKWTYVIALNVILLAAFLIYPLTSVLIDIQIDSTTISLPFAWLHIVALAVLISPLGRKAAKWVITNDTARIATGIAILAFIATMMQHLMGNLLFRNSHGTAHRHNTPRSISRNMDKHIPSIPNRKASTSSISNNSRNASGKNPQKHIPSN